MAKAAIAKNARKKGAQRDGAGARRTPGQPTDTSAVVAGPQAAPDVVTRGAKAVDKLARKEALKNAALRAAAKRVATDEATAAAARPVVRTAPRQAPTHKKR
jgi:hypothetical protein